jgi:hypothetical protein
LQRAVSRVAGTFDVAGVCTDSKVIEECAQALEYIIDCRVPTATLPPAFGDTCVVAPEVDVWAVRTEDGEGIAVGNLESNSLRPLDVPLRSAVFLPARQKVEGVPPSTDEDANADLRAGVWVGLNVDDLHRTRYGVADVRCAECIDPPVDLGRTLVAWSERFSRWDRGFAITMWAVKTDKVVEAVEIRLPGREKECDVLEMSSKALSFFKVMFLGAVPLMQWIKVPDPHWFLECNHEGMEVPNHPVVRVLISKFKLFFQFP